MQLVGGTFTRQPGPSSRCPDGHRVWNWRHCFISDHRKIMALAAEPRPMKKAAFALSLKLLLCQRENWPCSTINVQTHAFVQGDHNSKTWLGLSLLLVYRILAQLTMS